MIDDKQTSDCTAGRFQVVLELAEGLQRVGTPPARVESLLTEVAESLGIEGRYFSLPTAVFASFRTHGREVTQLVPAPTGGQDLGQLEALRSLATELAVGSLSVQSAREQLASLKSAPPPFSSLATVVSFGWSSAMAAVLFGGGWVEAAVAGVSGLLIGALHLRGLAWGLSGLLEATSAAIAAFVASLIASSVGYATELAVLSALIVLVPGFTIHRGLTNLSTGHIMSGSAWMAQAGTVLLLMGFGVAFGGRIAEVFVGAPSMGVSAEMPSWAASVALVVMTPSLQVLFRAPPRSGLWMMGSICIAWWGALFGERVLGNEASAFVGAFLLGVYALLWERIFDRPAALPLAPGLMVLVPGAVGFQGVAALLGGDPVGAVETGFAALMVATSLVTGLLAANLLVRRPDRPVGASLEEA